jgi:hypothetical protein
MGLDNYWMKTKGEEGTIEGEFIIWNGEPGYSSFRGKVYSDIVKEITGVSLHDAIIPNNVVKEMADCLKDFNFEQISTSRFQLTQEEYNDFVKMFKLHASKGHYLVSSW